MDHMGKITGDTSSLSAPFSSQDTKKEEKEKFKLAFVTQAAPKSGIFSGMQWTFLGPRNQL